MSLQGNKRYSLWLFILSVCLAVPGIMNAQGEKKFLREGNREYFRNNFSESEISYRRALDKNNSSADAVFNTGDALYKQKKYEDAGKQFLENSKMNEDQTKESAAFYNLGNSLLMAEKVQESIEAYKNSLRLNPGNTEAKYNLAYAQDLLKQQQQQQQRDRQKQDKNQENKENRQNSKDQEQNNDQPQDQNREQDQQQQKEQPQGISKEDAERLLNAIANDEKNVQEKVKLEKAAKTKVRTLKNW